MGATGDREQPAADLHTAAGAAERPADVKTAFAAAVDALFAGDARLWSETTRFDLRVSEGRHPEAGRPFSA